MGYIKEAHANGQLALEGDYFRGRSFELRMWDEEGAALEVRPDVPADSVGGPEGR